MIKQIKDLSTASINDLNDNCQFVMDDSTGKTKKVSFNVLKQKIEYGAVVGSIIPYMGTGLPEGYLMCDGSEVDKITYSELYAVIGDRFGTASDTSKFKLPKIDDARYLQGSDTPGTVVKEGLPNLPDIVITGGAHSHSGTFITIGADSYKRSLEDNFYDLHNGSISNSGEHTHTASYNDSNVYGKSNTVTPLSITVRYLICYKRVIGKVDATGSGGLQNPPKLMFYPCKSVQQSRPTDCVSYVVETGRFSSVDGTTHSTASENDSWYRLYSDGWCEMGGKKTYLASTGDNTETVTFAKSFLDTSFTLTFGAGSSGATRDNGHIVNEDQNYRTVNTFGIQVTDPNASTKDAWNCWHAEGFVSITPKTT